MTLLIWSQKLTNTQLDLTHRWGFWSSFWSRPRQKGFSLAGKGRRVLSLHSSVPWDLFYWTSLNNSIKTPKEAGWTCGLVFSCQKQGAAGQGGRKRGSKEQERKHTHGKEKQPETEWKEKVRGRVCVCVHVCICPCTPAPQHPWHLVRPIKQQHWWTPKNRQQCCGATNTNAQGVLSVGEGKGTSWMGNLEINIFHCKEQNSKATTISFHVPIFTIIPHVPKKCSQVLQVFEETLVFHTPVISEGMLLFTYSEAALSSSPPSGLPLVAKQLQPFCRTCLPTTSSLNHYRLLKNKKIKNGKRQG